MGVLCLPIFALCLARVTAEPPAAQAAAAELPRCEAAGPSQELDECSEDEGLAPVQLLQSALLLTRSTALELEAGGRAEQAQAVAADAPTTATTTPSATGMTMNAVGDLKTFITALVMNYFATFVCILGFSAMRLRYPIVYQHNAMEGKTPSQPGDTLFGWFGPTMALTIDQIQDCVTLDHAMLIEYSHLGMKIMLTVGLPMFFIQGPLNWAFGGLAAGQDHLSYLSFGNVSNGSWLYWIHCFVVWAVVIYTTWQVHDAMRKYLPRRYRWLRSLSELRANTVLVEGIPEEYRCESKLQDFFKDLLPGASVQKVECVKDTGVLAGLVSMHESALHHLKSAEAEAAAHPETKPMVRESFMGSRVEAVPYWKKQSEDLEPRVTQERQRVLAESRSVGGVNLSSAFVTFGSRTHAELALRLDGAITFDQDEWNMLTAPDPSDILWADLTQDDGARSARAVVGYVLVVALYFVYMPLVIFITNVGKMVDLSTVGLGSLQSVWNGVAPTLGLQFMVAMLPTFLILIFQSFFTLRAEVLQQAKLQVWYFWFQVVFVLLATAVGQNFREFAMTCVTDPMAIIPVLAKTMPYATHYYMNFLVLQAMSHGMNVSRYIPWMKYKGLLQIFDEKDAKALAEPEDQDYYGMGSRSARWTTMLGVGLIYGTLSPPINVLCFINFFVCRVVYGYLVTFAERHKSDSGGVFFVTQLMQTFPLLIIYVLLMAGVFYQRAATCGPCVISALALIWIVASLNKFRGYTWEKLPMEELEASKHGKKHANQGQYVQPEMLAK